jgi:hypothetical protein
MVEQQFGYLLPLRYLSPFHFLVETMLKYFVKNSKDRDEIAEIKTELNPDINKKFVEMTFLWKNQYTVQVTDSRQGIATVRSNRANANTTELWTVNLSLPIRHRCCVEYWQQNYLCPHAYAVVLALNLESRDDFYTEKYFARDCFTSVAVKMFEDVPKLLGKVPSTSDINVVKEKAIKGEITAMRTICHGTYINNTTETSVARILSTGEQGRKRKPQDKVACPGCNKYMRRDTLRSKHIIGGEGCVKRKLSNEKQSALLQTTDQMAETSSST